MAAPGGKASSRWGSFLQQAVAGVESRLDTILAESDDDRGAAATTATNNAAGAKASSTGKWLQDWGHKPRADQRHNNHSNLPSVVDEPRK
jgi:hypothetical protein